MTHEQYDDEVYYMAVALMFSKKSPDPNTKVGACIVNEKKIIVGVGTNTMPDGCEDKFPWAREAEDKLETKYPYVCHAELNAIMNKTSVDVKGCTMYVTLFPCNECAKVIIQSGIKEVVYLSNKYAKRVETIASDLLLTRAGIGQRQFDLKQEVADLLNSIDPFAE
ncbi:deoxycytidylate deaminase-like isoform X2 [Tachysurus fulvidraco]|uniref:deoxycytidylate deaminase-like isoform X2 n=1 Tax=Tachysurus fulvidraco TaxID=1234273 RepID=UPI001FEE256A|nr:deoxycytidylate deaminase-like isoform X2 [Tachysurus fulvidraco]